MTVIDPTPLLPQSLLGLRMGFEAVTAALVAKGNDHYRTLLASNSAAYLAAEERADFYLWFYERALKDGHEVRWPLAAAHVVYQINVGVTLWSLAEGGGALIGMIDNDTQALLRRGNQVIFDDVFPKLLDLITRTQPLKGPAAIAWDAKVLIEEQYLVQAIYADPSMSESIKKAAAAAQQGFLHKIAASLLGVEVPNGPGRRDYVVEPFTETFADPVHRWRYGMRIAAAASTIVPKENGIPVPVPADPPAPGPEYRNGTALAKVDLYPRLHLVEALADNTMSPDERERAREVLKTLSAIERRFLLDNIRFSVRLRKAGFTWQLFLECVSTFQVDLEKQLLAVEPFFPVLNGWSILEYDDVRPMIRTAPAEQRRRIRGEAWRKRFVAICDNTTIDTAIADLELDATEAALWRQAER